ncbi:IspD/TarI family cytidylyltransferase [Spirochaeta dissipatitropha]
MSRNIEKKQRDFSLLLLNGGIGRRVSQKQPKQFFKVNGIPIIVYSLVAADQVEQIKQIIVNYPEGWLPYLKELIDDYAIKKPIVYVPAGETRHESVSLMVQKASCDDVIIHEAARPMVTSRDFEKIIQSEQNNISYMLPISFTVAPVDPETFQVTGSLDRNRLRNVQLPQKFSKEDLLSAHKYAEERKLVFTEDATLCAVAGFDVFYLDGNDRNIKVTTPTDVKVAGFLLTGVDKDE